MSTLSQEQIESLSEHLESAELQARAVHKITDDHANLTISASTLCG